MEENKDKDLITENKILHMHGVAEYMYQKAPKYHLDSEKICVRAIT